MAQSSGSEGVGEEGGSDGELELENLTSAEALEKLEEAWRNEKFAPDLLPHKSDLVDCMLDLIRTMEENLSHLSKGDLVANIHKLELERIQYVICSYLRTRLKKIECFVWHLLEQEATQPSLDQPRLSPEELVYAKSYAESLDTHLHTLVLSHLPTNFQNIDRRKAVPRPPMNSYVFMRALEQKSGVVVDPDDAGADSVTVDMASGSQWILRYQPVADLVLSGAAQLI